MTPSTDKFPAFLSSATHHLTKSLLTKSDKGNQDYKGISWHITSRSSHVITHCYTSCLVHSHQRFWEIVRWQFYHFLLQIIPWFSGSLNCSLCIYIYMSDCENPRFTERTSTNLGRSHRLPHVCTIMIYGKLGGYRLQETAAFIYIYVMNYE